MTKEQIRVHLLKGGQVQVGPWTFWAQGMHCCEYDDEYGYCCEESYSTIEDCVNHLLYLAEDDLSNVELLNA